MQPSRRGFLIGLGAVIAAPAIVRATSLMPVKAPRFADSGLNRFAGVGVEAPEGWLPCYGQQLSRARYADLFRTIGVTFGDGDGFSTFNLPDLRGRAPSVIPAHQVHVDGRVCELAFMAEQRIYVGGDTGLPLGTIMTCLGERV
jgi:hypothetical protein